MWVAPTGLAERCGLHHRHSLGRSARRNGGAIVGIRFFVLLEDFVLVDKYGRYEDQLDVVGEFIAETNESIKQLVDAVQSEVFSEDMTPGPIVHGETEQQLHDEPEKLAEYRVKAQLFTEKLHSLYAEKKATDRFYYLIRYLQLMAKELGIKSVSGQYKEDGPCHLYTWRHNGRKLDEQKLEPTTWRLLNHLWHAHERTAFLIDLAEPVFQDHELIPDKDQVGTQRSKANNFFKAEGILLKVKIKDDKVLLQKL